MGRRLPRVSLATVYNALELFVRTGLASKLTYGDAAARYDIRTPNCRATGFRFEVLGRCRSCRVGDRAARS